MKQYELHLLVVRPNGHMITKDKEGMSIIHQRVSQKRAGVTGLGTTMLRLVEQDGEKTKVLGTYRFVPIYLKLSPFLRKIFHGNGCNGKRKNICNPKLEKKIMDYLFLTLFTSSMVIPTPGIVEEVKKVPFYDDQIKIPITEEQAGEFLRMMNETKGLYNLPGITLQNLGQIGNCTRFAFTVINQIGIHPDEFDVGETVISPARTSELARRLANGSATLRGEDGQKIACAVSVLRSTEVQVN